jgi:hypothetical protein
MSRAPAPSYASRGTSSLTPVNGGSAQGSDYDSDGRINLLLTFGLVPLIAVGVTWLYDSYVARNSIKEVEKSVLHGYDIYRGLKIIDHTTKCKPEDDPLESGVISKNNSEMQSLRDEIAELKKLLADANKEIADLMAKLKSQGFGGNVFSAKDLKNMDFDKMRRGEPHFAGKVPLTEDIKRSSKKKIDDDEKIEL